MMFVLDASAILALLLDEAGEAEVMAAIRHSEVSIVNMCEVVTKVAERGGDPDEAYGIVVSYGVKVREFREAHAIEVARLRPITRHLGLSLGDRACLAHGRLSKLPILTSDHRMAEADLGLDIRTIR